jgi:hypothetical protein
MQLKVGCVRHLNADQADTLLKSASDKADATGETIKARDDDLNALALGYPHWRGPEHDLYF